MIFLRTRVVLSLLISPANGFDHRRCYKTARPLDDERAEGNDEIYLSGFDETGNNLMPASQLA